MSRRDPLADAIAELTRLADDPRGKPTIERVRELLGASNSFIVSKAAKFVARHMLVDCERELDRAFRRFLEKSDKSCQAKQECARAAYEIEAELPDLFARGARHIQLEPGFDKPVDAAAELRAICAFGVVRTNHPELLVLLADLLGDSEQAVRSAGARALAFHGGGEVVPLLRLKARTGDEDPDVFTECLSALLAASPKSVDLVIGIARRSSGEATAPAMWALSSTTLPAAFEFLRERWNSARGKKERTLAAHALAGMRRDEAHEFLLERVAEESVPVAIELLEALVVFREDESLVARIRGTVERRDEGGLRWAFEELFLRHGAS